MCTQHLSTVWPAYSYLLPLWRILSKAYLSTKPALREESIMERSSAMYYFGCHFRCLELFPKILSVLELQEVVTVGESEMKGVDFKSHILNSLCSGRLDGYTVVCCFLCKWSFANMHIVLESRSCFEIVFSHLEITEFPIFPVCFGGPWGQCECFHIYNMKIFSATEWSRPWAALYKFRNTIRYNVIFIRACPWLVEYGVTMGHFMCWRWKIVFAHEPYSGISLRSLDDDYFRIPSLLQLHVW